jgi:ribosomal protein S18 acetylase RimI-like enzyme
VDREGLVTLRLRPLSRAELPSYRERSLAWYRYDLETNGGLSPEAAQRKVAADWSRLFPDEGLPEGTHLYAVEDEAGETVGWLWWTEREGAEGRTAYVYEISVEEAKRGRGYGREAMRLFEEDARANGIDHAAFVVLGGNEVARSLYRSLGYRETAVSMTKRLS